jgi:integrase
MSAKTTPARKITDAAVSKSDKRLRDSEIAGFVMLPRVTGKFFYLEYRSPVTAKGCRFLLGRFGNVSAQQARELAKVASGKIAQGIDPQAEKMQARTDAKRAEQSSFRVFLDNGYLSVTPPKTAKPVIASLKKHFPDLLDKPMASITAWKVEQWKRAYTGKPGGANRILAGLRGVMTAAVKAGLLDKSPMPDVKPVKADKSKIASTLSDADEQQLRQALDNREKSQREERIRTIEHCRTRQKTAPEVYTGTFTDYLKPLVIVALKTGLRRGELFNLQVGDIDLKNRWITVRGEADGTSTGSKSGQTRHVPISDEAFSVLVAWLNQLPGNSKKTLVFASPKTGGRMKSINTAWVALRTAANLPDLRFHDLRHTYGSRLARAGVDLVRIKTVMGHESLTTTARYLHTDNDSLQKIAEVIG